MLKHLGIALASMDGSVGWASSANQKVTSSIPSQGTWLGCGLCALALIRALAEGNQSMFLSYSFSLPAPLSKMKSKFKK